MFFSSQPPHSSYVLTLSSHVGFGIDSVFVDGVDVVFWRLQGSQLRAQVTVLAAVGTSGAWNTHSKNAGYRPEGWRIIFSEGVKVITK